jgi:hypothetical protein
MQAIRTISDSWRQPFDEGLGFDAVKSTSDFTVTTRLSNGNMLA